MRASQDRSEWRLGLVVELERQRIECLPEPDCVERFKGPGFGKRLDCRCKRLEELLRKEREMKA